MRKLSRLFIVFFGLLAIPLVAQAKVRISVDLSSQRMSVNADNGASYSWPISSARAGYVTPRGIYSAISLQTMHHSKNTIIRRCRIPFSSMAATPSMELTQQAP
jgi:hypothetical protein